MHSFDIAFDKLIVLTWIILITYNKIISELFLSREFVDFENAKLISLFSNQDAKL